MILTDIRKMAIKASQTTLLALAPRRSLARIARFLGNTARLDMPNDIGRNGELLVQSTVLSNAAKGRPLVVFDVGANRGEWVVPLLEQCDSIGCVNISVHCFEPVSSTMSMLRRSTSKPAWQGRIQYVMCALSDRVGRTEISVVGDGAGTNALTPDPAACVSRYEAVDLVTVDEYCQANSITHIALLKIDVEGHDLSVIRGAVGMLKRQAIDVIQFEYNHRWVWSHAFLFDAFAIADSVSYGVGKVTARGIEVYDYWHPELEKFVEGNYLLCKKDWLQRFPTFSWWNANSTVRE